MFHKLNFGGFCSQSIHQPIGNPNLGSVFFFKFEIGREEVEKSK